MKMHICTHVGCHNLTTADRRYCNAHQAEQTAYESRRDQYRKQSYSHDQRHYNQFDRDKEANAFYQSRHWKLLSRELRRDSMHICECCGKHSERVYVDHIIPRRIDKRQEYTISNLWVICGRCHYFKTQLESETFTGEFIHDLDASKKFTKNNLKEIIGQK